MRTRTLTFFLFNLFIIFSCGQKGNSKKTVFAIPVYGQSLALGEEAIRITNFDSLSKRTNHRVFTENLDEEFGFFSDTRFKQWAKKILGDRHRAFELSIYGMSEILADSLDSGKLPNSVVISIFPGGRGATSLSDMGPGSRPYIKFLSEIKGAYDVAHERGWRFEVPAFCWMQGENDIVWKSGRNYKRDLKQFHANLNKDVKKITQQDRDVVCVIYQSNCLTLSPTFKPNVFESQETLVPQAQLELLRSDPLFIASGPTYPYSFVGERVHIDGYAQKRLGYLAGASIIKLMEAKPSKGVIPLEFLTSGKTVSIRFNVPHPPLVMDTTAVLKAPHYGFSVINSANVNILQRVTLVNNTIILACTESPKGSKIRYAINGLPGKSGNQRGPRGNLRDSQGEVLSATILKKNYPLHNWSYQFDELLK